MTIFSKLLVGAAGVSMAALSASAGAQGYYPPPPPTPYNQGYNQQGGARSARSSTRSSAAARYGAYGQGNDRMAVDQCARAAEVRVSQDNRRGVYGGLATRVTATRATATRATNHLWPRSASSASPASSAGRTASRFPACSTPGMGRRQLWPVQPERPVQSVRLPEPGLRPARAMATRPMTPSQADLRFSCQGRP